jgi:hypothetical protein
MAIEHDGPRRENKKEAIQIHQLVPRLLRRRRIVCCALWVVAEHVVRDALCFCCGVEEFSLVLADLLEPSGDVRDLVLEIRREVQDVAGEARRHLHTSLLARVRIRPEPSCEITVHAGIVPSPVPDLVDARGAPVGFVRERRVRRQVNGVEQWRVERPISSRSELDAGLLHDDPDGVRPRPRRLLDRRRRIEAGMPSMSVAWNAWNVLRIGTTRLPSSA